MKTSMLVKVLAVLLLPGMAILLTGNLGRDSEALARHRMLGTGTGLGNSIESSLKLVL